ncbi:MULTISPECIES: hypothetical protein [Clostridium]|uniref:Uncharacterized protein n=2 Tax=Clostridium TaxID=1485 RepID=A0A1S8RQZ8_CLOBE|nr:hypothetical protein [Clostridium beijerinckii]NRY63263.1 hypothetical protein [Clostridium beijerinckii]OOM55610.1 hypothetical protein CLBCK_44920 [Clostridium beijerinckii]
MNIKELIRFLKVCEMRSISKASKDIFISHKVWVEQKDNVITYEEINLSVDNEE